MYAASFIILRHCFFNSLLDVFEQPVKKTEN
jgi:hypothetical protein